eukprot:CAMPEP_0202688160 /NCGR_PEP_ID=MMETSP1385-20130828/3687_1 /ASSEMBLY_ACC=CAM_ASM_000861 /TAXON_ID=933848 /ORGANISM="Elphidium margaritaceum" /LENGTH=199 /DNA_ID=CAMNT_0049343061 /DNA_START=113 /DNA_END=712 /DNA_ORIENTATION=-
MSEDGDAQLKYSIHYEGDEEAVEYYTKDGKATVQYANGDTYTGELTDGKKSGKGVYVWKETNATYDGEWDADVRTGHGKFVYPDGSQYEGEWLDNARNGKGTTIYANGDSYCGEYKDGLRAGQGIYTYKSDRSQLIGEWKNDIFASGKWRYNDKTQFVGNFNGNIPNGNGVFTFPSKNQLHGVYQNGKFCPQSMVYNEV